MKNYIAEFLATYALVFFGTGSIIVNEISQGSIGHPGIAITFGLIVMTMIYTFGEKSGAHMNPAVTIAFAVRRLFSFQQMTLYIMSQLIGALAASSTLKLLFPSSIYLGATIPVGSITQSFILECILSFFLMLTILAVAEGGKEKGLFAGLAIGSVVLLEALFAGPVSGASMNPARSLGPAILSGNIDQLWVYLTAPVSGMLLAVLIHRKI